MSQVKLIAWQLIQAFSFLHEIGITHGDVKPDNYLFANDSFNVSDPCIYFCRISFKPFSSCFYLFFFQTRTVNDLKNAAVKLVDFGLAVTKHDHRTSRTGMRNYRSPEMIFRLGWSFPSDVWALA